MVVQFVFAIPASRRSTFWGNPRASPGQQGQRVTLVCIVDDGRQCACVCVSVCLCASVAHVLFVSSRAGLITVPAIVCRESCNRPTYYVLCSTGCEATLFLHDYIYHALLYKRFCVHIEVVQTLTIPTGPVPK